jgi:hypothetical protein
LLDAKRGSARAKLALALLRANATRMETFKLRERLGTATEALGGPVVAPPTESGRSLPFTVAASGLPVLSLAGR